MSERKPPIVARLQTDRLPLIALRWNKPSAELLIALCDGESLRELIAAPNIVGIALVRREDAVAGILGNSSDAADSNEHLADPVCGNGNTGRELQSSSLVLRRGLSIGEIRRMAAATLQRGIAAGVLMFYSTSIIGTTIRVLVGA